MKTLNLMPEMGFHRIGSALAVLSLASAGNHARKAVRIAAERRALADMDAEALEDVGLTARQAERESRRAFWDLPAGR